MSDRENEPEDLFDAVCRLDDLADWLRETWPEEAEQIRQTADALKGYIVISFKPKRKSTAGRHEVIPMRRNQA